MRNRGFTLIELIISTAIGAMTVAVAVRFFADHTHLLNNTMNTTQMNQDARLAMNLLVRDLRHAGAGAAYRPDGRFAGLLRGSFSAPGGAQFYANDTQLSLESGEVPTDDLGLRVALGDVRTIASSQGNVGEVCSGGGYKSGDVVLMLTREGLHARSAKLGSLSATQCTDGQCERGCELFTIENDDTYLSDLSAVNASFSGGEMLGDFAQVVWFVVGGADAKGQLRRAETSNAAPCSNRDEDCGGTIAEGVETLQIAVHQWDPTTASWLDRTLETEITGRERIRVDVEMVAKATVGPGGTSRERAKLSLSPGTCIPMPCDGSRVDTPRQVLRASVELKNSGKMMIR